MKRKKWGVVFLVLFLMSLTTACAGASKNSKESDADSVSESVSNSVSEPAASVSESAASSSETSEYYQLGDKVDDFTATMSDGTKVVLSDLLKEKKMVLINFWATWCGPCRREFPVMQEAYTEMSDEVAVVVLSKEETDTDEKINALKEELGLTTLPMGKDSGGVIEKYAGQESSIPASFVVDRNGILCFSHTGMIDSKDKFIKLFKVYTDSEYDEPVLLDELPPLIDAPAQPSAEEMRAALGITDEKILVKIPEDTKIWPFYPSKDGSYVKATNDKVTETTASVGVTVSVEAGQALSFDYISYSDAKVLRDALRVSINGEEKKAYLKTPDWKTTFIEFDKAGDYTVDFDYFRSGADEGSNPEADGRLANLHVIDKQEVAQMKAEEADYPKQLPQDQMQIDVLEGEMKQVTYTGLDQVDNDIVVNALKDEGDLLMQSDEATLRIKVGSEIDPTQAGIIWNLAPYFLSELEYDEEGYLVHIKKTDSIDEELGANFIAVYSSFTGNVHSSAYVKWYSQKEQADNYIKSIKESMTGCEALGWEAADAVS